MKFVAAAILVLVGFFVLDVLVDHLVITEALADDMLWPVLAVPTCLYFLAATYHDER